MLVAHTIESFVVVVACVPNESKGSPCTIPIRDRRFQAVRPHKRQRARIFERVRTNRGSRCATAESGPYQALVESHNGRFLRHRFSPKSKSVATQNSLPKKSHVAKERGVHGDANQHATMLAGQHGKPNDAPTTKPLHGVKTMLGDAVEGNDVSIP